MCKCKKDPRLHWLEHFLCENFPNNPYVIEPYSGYFKGDNNILYYGSFFGKGVEFYNSSSANTLPSEVSIDNMLIAKFSGKDYLSGYQIIFQKPVY